MRKIEGMDITVKEILDTLRYGSVDFVEMLDIDDEDNFNAIVSLLSYYEKGKRPITRYLSNRSLLQYTVIKKLEDFLCHNPSSH